MAASKYPSRARLRQLFDYHDGKLFWKYRDLGEFASAPTGRYWNRKMAGTEAGCEAITDSGPRWVVMLGGKRLYRSVIVFKICHGFQPAPPRIVDHKDRNSLNDKIGNLRIGGPSSNMANSRLSKSNKSGYKGVNWVESRQKFQVYATINGKSKFLGYFDDPVKGHSVYMDFLREHHGKFASDGK